MIAPRDVPTCLQLAREAFTGWRFECERELELTCQELARLQGLLDDAMHNLRAEFEQGARSRACSCASCTQQAGHGRLDSNFDRAVIGLQFHDMSSQLLRHMQQRMTRASRLIDDLAVPFSFAAAAAEDDRATMRAGCEGLEELWHGAPGEGFAPAASPVQSGALHTGTVELF